MIQDYDLEARLKLVLQNTPSKRHCFQSLHSMRGGWESSSYYYSHKIESQPHQTSTLAIMAPLASSQEDYITFSLTSLSSEEIDASISPKSLIVDFVDEEETTYISITPACTPQTKETDQTHVRKTVGFKSRVRARACLNRNSNSEEQPRKHVRKTTVDFKPRVQVRSYLNRCSYSEQEMESTFMSRDECQLTKDQLRASALKINNGSFQEDNDETDCKLGLDGYSSFNRAVRLKLTFGALHSVLLQQEILKQASKKSCWPSSMLKKTPDASTRIAQVYNGYSHQAQIHARRRALKNAQEVQLEDTIGQKDYEKTTMYKVSLDNDSSFSKLLEQ